VPDHHPRYVVRTLHGWAIGAHGQRGKASTTYMLLDSWYGYAVVLQRETGVSRPKVRLRAQFERAAAYMNAPAKPCAREGCEGEVPRAPLDTGYRMRGLYCSSSCKHKAKYRREVAAGRRGRGRLA
jgi:hypothetical protein